MKRSIVLWQLMGFAVTSFAGTILHFLYEWLGEALWIAPFSGVNESTFEHMKLLFWPMLVYAIVESLFFRQRDDFFAVKLCGILLGLVTIPVLFYTYNGAIGKSPDWLNILIFFIAAAVAYVSETYLYYKERLGKWSRLIPLAVLGTVALLFIIFTFYPPRLGIFKDPLTGQFGI